MDANSIAILILLGSFFAMILLRFGPVCRYNGYPAL